MVVLYLSRSCHQLGRVGHKRCKWLVITFPLLSSLFVRSLKKSGSSSLTTSRSVTLRFHLT